MVRKLTLDKEKEIKTGDYKMPVTMQRKPKSIDRRKKQLVNLPDDQKAWIMSVVQLAIDRGQDCNQTMVLRAIVGSAMQEDPESFVGRLEDLAKKARLAEIERRFAALEAEKAKLLGNATDGHETMESSRGSSSR